jgi:3-oxoacyl-[acyl-carrier-protein] synthase II
MFGQLAAGRSGIGRLEFPGAERLRSPIGAAAQFEARHLTPAQHRLLDRVSHLALFAASEAVAEAGLDFAAEDRERCGVCVGTSLGGAATTDAGYLAAYGQQSGRIPTYSVLGAMANAPASWIAIEYGLTGPNLTYSTACSSSAVAVGEATRRIQQGDADVMLAGGAEAPLALGVLLAWDALRVLATVDPIDASHSCRPFSANRSGLVLGEGAAVLVLENWAHAKARGAPIVAELAGYGLVTDIAHITRPSVEGQARAMRAALRRANLSPDQIGYVNAHGTGTVQNDLVETQALKEVFGSRALAVPVSSTKSMHGHLLGAAGALEFLIAVVAMKKGIVPPTMHLDCVDAQCDLDYVAGKARAGLALEAVMSNSFAFGGTNAVLIARSAA